jgi:hypothetical protein
VSHLLIHLISEINIRSKYRYSYFTHIHKKKERKKTGQSHKLDQRDERYIRFSKVYVHLPGKYILGLPH